MAIHDYGPAPQPPWRTEDGDLLDADTLRSGHFEIDLTGETARIVRKQRPNAHPWDDKWPTWVSL